MACISRLHKSVIRFGASGYIVTRPQLYNLLLRQIPRGRIYFGKKVLSMENGGNGVLIRCSDGYEADGDILVGADGAYSAVRQSLYEKLKKVNRLPPSDALPLPFSTVCLVAQTVPISPEEFPDLALGECQFRKYVNTKTMYSVRRIMKTVVVVYRSDCLRTYLLTHSSVASPHLVEYSYNCPEYHLLEFNSLP